MKKATDERFDDLDEMPAEVDFSRGVRGKYAGSVEPLNNLIFIEPELFEASPSAAAVNEALCLLKKVSKDATALSKGHDEAKAS